MWEFILERANYWAIIALMMIGLYIAFQSNNMIKRLVGLSVFQTSIFLFYISLGKVVGGTAPILYGRDYPKSYDKDHGGGPHGGDVDVSHGDDHSDYASAYEPLKEVYSNPLPHVLILTAIVVGVATLAVGLAIVVRVREAYGSIESDDIRAVDQEVAEAERDNDPEASPA